MSKEEEEKRLYLKAAKHMKKAAEHGQEIYDIWKGILSEIQKKKFKK